MGYAFFILFSLAFTMKVEKEKVYDPNIGSFDKDVAAYYRLLKLPGLAVGIAKGDSIIYFKGLGSSKPGTQQPITPDHIFGIASVTKSFTSVALQQMEDEKLVSLSDKINAYPNKYFTKSRWNSQTTVAQVISHTSESNPPGTVFIYNGSLYNLVLNVFDSLCKTKYPNDITRCFTSTIEKRILYPLHLNSTIMRFDSVQYEKIKDNIVIPYNLNEVTGAFTPEEADLRKMQSGPGFGMMSSVRDLVLYADALEKNTILPLRSYQKITTPFYKGSPQGMGWFTTSFEGINLHWAYGYGNNDAALFLRVPGKNLSLVVLSNCSLPSASARLGYGNPLNSLIVISFLKNILLNNEVNTSIDCNNNISEIEKELTSFTKKSNSSIFQEEIFTQAFVRTFLPTGVNRDRKKAAELIKMLSENYPGFILPIRTEAFELLSEFDDPEILEIGSHLCGLYRSSHNFHPVKSFYSGVIKEKSRDTANAILFYKEVADDDSFKEQSVKHDACMKLAKYYFHRDKAKAKNYLEKLVRYKEMISVQDKMYGEAKEMYSKLK